MWGDGGAYAAWTSYLSRWGADLGAGDEQLPALAREDFQPETWVRLTNRLLDAVNGRFRLWGNALTADIGRSESEFAVGRALAQARTGLASILRLAEHPSLPQDLREQLRNLVEQQVRSLQQSLDRQMDQQSGPRDAVEARRRTIRENPLTAVLTPVTVAPDEAGHPAVPAPATADPWAFDPTARPRRTLAVD